MSPTAARSNARFALAAACAMTLSLACASSPDLAIVSPAPGATLTAAQDLDPATPGLQAAVDATTSAPDGSLGTASAGGAPVQVAVSGGHLRFPRVTFSDGAATLTVSVVGDHDKLATAIANYSVDSSTSGCKISSPTNHSVLSADPGDTGLVSVVVQAVCRGLTSGVQVGLLENDDAAPGQLQAPGADGAVTFNADLIPGNNVLSVVAKGVAYDAVEVTLTSTRCRAEIEPPSGTVFDLSGANGAIVDTNPTTTGLQANISVKTGCADGVPASLSISSGGTVQVTSTSTVHGGVATFAVTLPDGALDAQAFVGAPGQEGASRHATYTSDGTAPSITVLSPVSGGLLGPQDNVGTPTQFVARIRGQIAGFNSGGYAALEIDQGTAQAMEIPVAPDLTSGIFSTDVALSPGVHSLFAKVVRASGNTAVSATIEFTVVISGTALAVVAPANGADIGLTQLTPGANTTASLTFLLQSAGLVGARANVDCGSGLTGTGVIGADGKVSIPIDLPISSCAGALFRCVATANGTTAPTTTFTADDTAPAVTITQPTAGPTTATSTEFKATTDCAGEGELFTLDNGGTIIGSGTVQNNSIDLPGVVLHAGQNQLHLIVTDGAGNSSTAEVDVTSSANAFPVVAFVEPTNGETLVPGNTDLDCSTVARPVLSQVQISISGDSVTAAGLVLTLTNNGTTQTVSNVPTFANGVWTYSNVAIAPGSNTFAVTATDAEGVQGQATATFMDRCAPLNVVLAFLVNGSNFGYAQDKDHSTPGEQVDVQVTASAANGAAVRLCSTALSATPAGCTTAGTGAVPVIAGSASIQNGVANFTVTIPDGPQTLDAEVTDTGTDVSPGKTVHVRATPPTVSSITLSEDTRGQTLGSLPDNALNQMEMDASNGTLHFQVVFGAGSFVAGQTVQIFSTSVAQALGSAVVAANGDGTTATSVPVPLALLNTGGYQSDVFYALVQDDAANSDSTPSAPVASVAPTTLGTTASPFIIAPEPTVALTSPPPGTNVLNASADERCTGTVCPDSDPLVYALGATTSAPDSSIAGAASEITFLANGTAIAPQAGETNPTATSGGAVTGVDLPLSNGATVSLTAQVEDPYGNVASSATSVLNIDSILPELAISSLEGQSTASGLVIIDQPQVDAVVSVDATGAGALENGQQISIYSDGTAVGIGTYAGSSSGAGTLTISITVGAGVHLLEARASDKAGNAGASPDITVNQSYSGPLVALTNPAPVQGTLYFGLATKSATSNTCAPSLTYTTTNIPDGNNVLVWVTAAASCGNAPGNAQFAQVNNSQATVSAAAFNIADGATGRLCAQTSDNSGNTATSAAQSFQCDLQTPTVAWVYPAANQKFVANGQTQIVGATPSTSADTTKLGLADAQLTIFAPTGGMLTLAIDQDNTPAVTTTQFVKCTVAVSASAQTIYALSSNNCSTSNSGGQLLAPIDYAQLLAHTLTANFSAPSGNAAAAATQAITADVAEPSAVSPSVVIKQAIGVATVTIPNIPGDDQNVGANPASWEVRYSNTAITANNWGSATLVTANLAGAFPTGVPTPFQVVLPAGNQALFLGVRAKDRVGNLGDLASGSVVQVSTVPTITSINVVDDSGGPPTTPALYTESMRVADLDGDGYDDVILNYSYAQCGVDGFCNGRVLIYFGGAGGVSNANAPLVLSGTIFEGYLGLQQSFDVGDFDGDGKVDIAAAETDDTTAHVLIWTGASIAAAKASGTAPTPLTLSDPNYLVGGTVRAVGHITGGSGAGDDLAISNFTNTINSGQTTYELALLQRGGAWSKNAATANIFSTGSPATSFIQLPLTVANDPNTPIYDATVEVAPFTYAGAAGDLTGIAVALLDSYDNEVTSTSTSPIAVEHETKLFGGNPLANVSWASGTTLPSPVASSDAFGAYAAGGLDAIGDGHADLMISDIDNGALYVYDGAALLGPSVTSEPTTATMVLNAAVEMTPGSTTTSRMGSGAVLMPDLDGDGKAEMTGGIEANGTEPLDLWFGQTGDAAPVPLPFFANCTNSTALQFCFTPARGQHIQGTRTPIGQRNGSGHVTSLTGRDLVILSQPVYTATSSSAQGGILMLMR